MSEVSSAHLALALCLVVFHSSTVQTRGSLQNGNLQQMTVAGAIKDDRVGNYPADLYRMAYDGKSWTMTAGGDTRFRRLHHPK